jgi:cytochrome c biogenesis protein
VKFDDISTGNQFGAPRDFEADVTYRRSPTAPLEKKTIRVNHPLEVDNAKVFLVGNGYAPMITIRDGKGNIAASGPVPMIASDAKYTSSGPIKAPDAKPRPVGLLGLLLPTAAVKKSTGQPISVFPDARNPRFIFTAFTGDLGLDSGAARSVYMLDVSKMTQLKQNGEPFSAVLAKGQSVALPDGTGTVTFEGLRRYAAFDVRSDPTNLYVLIAAVTALLGVTGSLFVRRRRVWVRAIADPKGGTVMEVAGLARTDDAGLDDEIAQVRHGIEAANPAGRAEE